LAPSEYLTVSFYSHETQIGILISYEHSIKE